MPVTFRVTLILYASPTPPFGPSTLLTKAANVTVVFVVAWSFMMNLKFRVVPAYASVRRPCCWTSDPTKFISRLSSPPSARPPEMYSLAVESKLVTSISSTVIIGELKLDTSPMVVNVSVVAPSPR